MSDTQRLNKWSTAGLEQLLQWAWPTPIESTTRPVLPLGSILEEKEEDEGCYQGTQGMGDSIMKKCRWNRGLGKLSGLCWRNVHVNVKCNCLETRWERNRGKNDG